MSKGYMIKGKVIKSNLLTEEDYQDLNSSEEEHAYNEQLEKLQVKAQMGPLNEKDKLILKSLMQNIKFRNSSIDIYNELLGGNISSPMLRQRMDQDTKQQQPKSKNRNKMVNLNLKVFKKETDNLDIQKSNASAKNSPKQDTMQFNSSKSFDKFKKNITAKISQKSTVVKNFKKKFTFF